MKLPRFTAKTPPPRFAGAARATDIGALTRTGEGIAAQGKGMVARAISGAGQAIQGVSNMLFRVQQERHSIDTGIQHAKATSTLNTGYTNILGELSNAPVESEAAREELRGQSSRQMQDLYSETLRGIDNVDAANLFRRSWETSKAGYDTGIFQTLSANLDKQQKFDKMTEWESLLINSTPENLSSIKEGVKQDVKKHIPLFGAAWAKNFIKNINIRTTAIREKQYKDLIYNGQSNLAVLTVLIQQDDSIDKEALLDDIGKEQKRRETQAKVLQDQIDEDLGNDFRKLLINKLDPTKSQLTFEQIEQSEASPEAKDMWSDKLRVFDNYSEGELKEAFTDKGEVIAEIYDKIDAGTLTDELDTLVGNGLSPETAQKIKEEIRLPYERDSEQMFKRFFGWKPDIGFPDNLSGAYYEKVLRDWKKEIKDRDATGEEIIEIGREIARPFFIDHVKRTMRYGEKQIEQIIELALGEPGEVEEPEEEKITKIPESPQPKTEKEFLAEVGRLKGVDMKKAEEYYNKWRESFK